MANSGEKYQGVPGARPDTVQRPWLYILLLPVAGGLLLPAGLAPMHFPAGTLAAASLPMLAVRRLGLVQSAIASLVYGTVSALATASWVYTAVHDHYRMGVLASAGFTVFIVGVGNGFFEGLPVFLWRLLVGTSSHPLPPPKSVPRYIIRPLLAGSVAFLTDIFRTTGPLSMPWGLIGAGLGSSDLLAQSVDLFGVRGHSFVAALTGGFLYEAVERYLHARPVPLASYLRHSPPLRWAGGVLAVLLLYGAVRSLWVEAALKETRRTGTPLRIAAIQANIRQGERWQPELVPRNMNRHLALSEQAAAESKPDVIIWPETAMNTYVTDSGNEWGRRLYALAFSSGAHLLLGGPHADFSGPGGGPRYFNSIFQVDPRTGFTARYDKNQLLLFAEFNPLTGNPLFPRAEAVPDDYTPGGQATLFKARGFTLGPVICFEALYPALVRNLVRSGAQVILNVSNDAWFGETRAAAQHMEQSRLRAIEHRKYLVRNAGTGISAIVDPLGRYAGTPLPIFTEGILSGEVYAAEIPSLYTAAGDWPLTLVSLLIAGTGLAGRLRKQG